MFVWCGSWENLKTDCFSPFPLKVTSTKGSSSNSRASEKTFLIKLCCGSTAEIKKSLRPLNRELFPLPFSPYISRFFPVLFDGWYINGTQKIVGLQQFDTYTPTENCTLVAVFTSTQPTEGKKQTFRVLVESELEFMGAVSGSQDVQQGYPVTISASPADDFEFIEWRDSNGAIVSEDNPYTFIPEEDTWLVGLFRQMKPLITVEVYHSFSGQTVEISASATSPVTSDITITGKWKTVGIAYNACDSFSITIEKNTLGRCIIVDSDFPVPDIYEHFEIYDLAYSVNEDDSYRYSFIVS